MRANIHLVIVVGANDCGVQSPSMLCGERKYTICKPASQQYTNQTAFFASSWAITNSLSRSTIRSGALSRSRSSPSFIWLAQRVGELGTDWARKKTSMNILTPCRRRRYYCSNNLTSLQQSQTNYPTTNSDLQPFCASMLVARGQARGASRKRAPSTLLRFSARVR